MWSLLHHMRIPALTASYIDLHKVGDLLAVAYEDGMDIGEITKVISPQDYVKFIAHTMKNEIMRQFHENFIRRAKQSVVPSPNLRSSILENIETICTEYARYS